MAQAVVAVPQAVATPPKAFKPYGSPPPFDLEAERDSFSVWLERWNIFLALSTIDEVLDAAAQPAYKTNQLKSCLSTATLQAVLSAGLTAAQLADHVAIIDLLRTRCNACRNRHVWRHQFAVCSQLPNQSADNWLCSLRDLSRKCDFNQDCCGNCEPTRILGQIISGVEDNAVRIKLLEKGDGLTLDQAIAILRSAENSRLQAASLQQTDYAINAIRRSTYKCHKDNTDVDKKVRFAQDKKSSEKSTTASCRYCGGPRRHSKLQCPAYGKECDNFGKDNHFAVVCEGPAKSVRSIHIQQVTSTSNDESVLIQIAALPNGPTLCTKGLPDTGSQLDAIPHSMYHTSFANIPLLPGAQAFGSEINCLGSFKATIDWKADDGISRPVPTTIHVLENLQQPVLCTATQRNLGMLPVKYPHARLHSISADYQFEPSESQKETDLAAIMAEVPRVFDGVCRIMAGPPCHLALKDGAIPVKIRGSRPISEPLKAPFRDELTTQVKQGIIRKVRPDEVTPWIHGVVVIPKNKAAFDSAQIIAH